MHELRIAEDLAAIVVEIARKEDLSKVTKVCLAFGQLVQIVPDIFDSAFRITVMGSVAADAELAIEILPVKLRCRSCGNDFSLEGNLFSCAVCNSTDIDIIQGKEMFIKSIEGE